MLHVDDGSGILDLMHRASRAPERYHRIVICAPFIDESGLDLLNRLLRAKPLVDVVLGVTPENRKLLERAFHSVQGVRILSCKSLHAKFYALVGRHHADNEAIITSANLTAAGLHRNLELGLSLRGNRWKIDTLTQTVITRLQNHRRR